MDYNDHMDKTNAFLSEQNPEHGEYTVETAEPGALKTYQYVLAFARYQDKWLYCRIRDEDVFGCACGHIERGETPLEAAKRELFEETGAVRFDITPAFDYAIHFRDESSHSQAFLVHIHELGELPDYEIAEIRLFDALPDKMRFPQILPVLYRRMQLWLNLQSGKGEEWDVYDSAGKLTGRKHLRGDPLPEGDFHLVVFVWLLNSKGEFLITKRAPNKGDPNMWENTGGSAIAGDDSLTAAIREVKEETGLDVKPLNGRRLNTVIVEDSIQDTWLFLQDFDLCDVVLQDKETVDAKYARPEEIRLMIANGEFIPTSCELEELFKLAADRDDRKV